MWNYTLPLFNESFYGVALWFLTYSVIGWIVESIYISLCNKKITNRGYIKGPICPIYGFGGTLIPTTVEYITAIVMIKLFGCLWWDYTNKPFNYKGILCLESSIGWGLYCICDMAFLKTGIFMVISYIPVKLGKFIIIFAIVYYLIDFIYTTRKNMNGEIEFEENNVLQFNK